MVQQTKADAEAAFAQMSEIAQKLAGFEATVRAAMAAVEAAKSEEEAGAGALGTPKKPKENEAEGAEGEAVAEGADGKGGGTDPAPGSSGSKRHPPLQKPKTAAAAGVIKTLPKSKKAAQRVADISDAALMAGRNWATITEVEVVE